jgi:transketolase
MVDINDLKNMANKLRIESLKSTTEAESGHPTSCMSCAEIMSCLFFSEMKAEDEFILSKGHAAPILWAAYAESGCIPRTYLTTLRRIDSILEGHPTPKMPSIRVATGSLGQGLSAGVGMALARKLMKSNSRIFVLLGDGECAEGSVWEAANSAAYYKLKSLCAIVDANRLGQSEPTMHDHDVDIYKQKFEAFGWNSKIVDGHNVKDLMNAFDNFKKSDEPFAIIAKTFKGKGVTFLENKEGWHGKPLNPNELKKALKEIGEVKIMIPSNVSCMKPLAYNYTSFEPNKYKKGEKVSTRAAFGNSLIKLGKKNKNSVVIDADVKNSTMTNGFFEIFPERSFQSFIAEQNMVGMAIGFSAMGFIPYVSTFATFLTRAHDFIRMGIYSMANIKFVGSHVGISIGPDGPSQMGLEDIPMFLSIPKSTVLYPCDAVSTEILLNEISKIKGISYIRTTREKTPVIYDNSEKFPIGGLKVIRKSDKDKALVVTAGVTIHESIKAYKKLLDEGINIRIIDLYSLQPLDATSLIKNAKECNNKVIAVEDHYCNAIGALISSVIPNVRYLCVRDIPRSGKPEELREKFKIDAKSICNMVKQFS